MVLNDLYHFVLSTVDGEEALKPEKRHHSWNIIFNRKSDLKYQRLSNISVNHNSPTIYLLTQHLVNIKEREVYSQQREKFERWIAWFLAFCDLDERKLHSLWLPAAERWLPWPIGAFMFQLSTKSSNKKDSSHWASYP